MSIPVPRELVLVLAEIADGGVTLTFDLGDPFDLDVAADWFTYGLAVSTPAGALLKHFGVKFFPTETTAFVHDFPSATQANYDGAHVDDRGTSVVVRFGDSSFGPEAPGLFTGFGTVEGEDFSADVPVQLL